MKIISYKFILGLIWLSYIYFDSPAKAQLAYESQYSHMGYYHKSYIYQKEKIDEWRWRFKIKTVFRCDNSWKDCKSLPPSITPWSIADCANSLIDENEISALPRSSSENGLPEILRSVCNMN